MALDTQVRVYMNGSNGAFWIWTYSYHEDFGQTAIGQAPPFGGNEKNPGALARLQNYLASVGKPYAYDDVYSSKCIRRIANPDYDPAYTQPYGSPPISPTLAVAETHMRRGVNLPQLTNAGGAPPLVDQVADKVKDFFRYVTGALGKNQTVQKIWGVLGIRG